MRAALLLILACSAPAAAAKRSRGPWLADASSTTARVCWRPAGAAQECRDLAGLQPNTTFAYTIPLSTTPYAAKTLPGPGMPLRFVVVGDGGKATRGQYDVAALIERLDPDFVVYTGDIVYPRGEDLDYDAKYFEPHAATLARRPFFHLLGNHDYGNFKDERRGRMIYERVYKQIHQRPKFYAFSAGDARFLMLDDNAAFRIGAAASLEEDGEQLAWLKGELAARSSKWLFAAVHVPLYATAMAHGDNAFLRRRLEPHFRAGNVTAVFAGHDHIYQRSKPRYGVTHLTVGTGGGGLSFGGHKPEWLAKEEERYGVLLVTLDASGLTGQFHSIDGGVVDEFSLARP